MNTVAPVSQADLRNQIFKAALGIAMRRGLRALNSRHIAETAGVSATTISNLWGMDKLKAEVVAFPLTYLVSEFPPGSLIGMRPPISGKIFDIFRVNPALAHLCCQALGPLTQPMAADDAAGESSAYRQAVEALTARIEDDQFAGAKAETWARQIISYYFAVALYLSLNPGASRIDVTEVFKAPIIC